MDVLTTGQIATYLSVSPRTVSRWFDSGRLKGFRKSGCYDRRIPVDSFAQFLEQNDLPAAQFGIGRYSNVLLMTDATSDHFWSFQRAATEKERFSVKAANSVTMAQNEVTKLWPSCLLIDRDRVDPLACEEICKFVRGAMGMMEIPLLGLSIAEAPLPLGDFRQIFYRPFDYRKIAARIAEMKLQLSA